MRFSSVGKLCRGEGGGGKRGKGSSLGEKGRDFFSSFKPAYLATPFYEILTNRRYFEVMEQRVEINL